jgi:hypothetical protein
VKVIGSTALGGGASYFHRAKRLCACGRELQKVPDDTRRVNDHKARATTAFNVTQAWSCALKGEGRCIRCIVYSVYGV